MIIAGLEKNSFVDFPGHMAAVVFTPGCNYDCFYCHNRILIQGNAPEIPEDEVMAFLMKRAGLLEGVVITGGEPTLQQDLADFAHRVRAFGYKVKLDTNGSHPEVVQSLLEKGLIDYVAMDYKAPFERYRELCGSGADPEPVRETLSLLRSAKTPYELRTTFVPQLSIPDIAAMTASTAPIPLYALQAYRPPTVYRKEDQFRVRAVPHESAVLRKAAQAAQPHADKVIIRE